MAVLGLSSPTLLSGGREEELQGEGVVVVVEGEGVVVVGEEGWWKKRGELLGGG